jgi:Uma2 family endonuclease
MSQTTRIQKTTQKLMTMEEYWVYDDGTDTHYELVNGELVAMPPENSENCNLASFLHAELLKHFPFYFISHKDLEIEVTGRRATCRLPDLVVHTEESRVSLLGSKRNTLTRDLPPPALVIEIVSAGERNHTCDYRHKRTEYAAREIAEYWIVDPETRQITVCQWVEGQYEDTVFMGATRLRSLIIPGWELTIDQLFALHP